MPSLFDAIKKANGLKRALTPKEKVVGPTYKDWAESWEKEGKAEVLPLGWTFKKFAVWNKPDGWKRNLEHRAESYQEGLNWLLDRGANLKNIKELPWSTVTSNDARRYDVANNSRKAFHNRLNKICLDPLSYVDDAAPAVRTFAKMAINGDIDCVDKGYTNIQKAKKYTPGRDKYEIIP